MFSPLVLFHLMTITMIIRIATKFRAIMTHRYQSKKGKQTEKEKKMRKAPPKVKSQSDIYSLDLKSKETD